MATATTKASARAGVAAGCFDISESADGQHTAMIPAEELRRRLPVLDSPFSKPLAFVGTSLTEGSLGSAYLAAFQSCSGSSLGGMRFGWVEGGTTLGVIPMGVEIDGFSGWDLAAMMIDGNAYDPGLRAKLHYGQHDGWEYLYTDGLAVTASTTTFYLMQSFCCVEAGDNTDLPSFEEIIHDYLDRTNDTPAPMPEEWHA